mgnify:CR=1 FL=1
MNYRPFLSATLLISLTPLHAEEPVSLSDAGRWSKEEIASKRPAVITPPGHTTAAKPGTAPSDAMVFFDGTQLSKWQGKDKDGSDAAQRHRPDSNAGQGRR